MIRKNKRERPFYETAYMRYINEYKFSRSLYDEFEKVFDVKLS